MTSHHTITQKVAEQFGVPRLVQHIVYWVFWVCFWAVMWGTWDYNFTKTFYIQVVELPFKLAAVYAVIYYLLPKFLFKSKYSGFIISYMIVLLAFGFVLRYTWFVLIEPEYFPERLPFGLFKFTELLNAILTINTAIIPPLVIKIIEYWVFLQQKSNTLERDKYQAELKFLRTQINPHFLFNSLNSLYALSLHKSELTGTMILRLSEIMRYIIYEASEAKVPFEKEIQFIENYINFEKTRVEKEVDISFSISMNRGGDIPPLLFIPIIENSFKHLRSCASDKPWIVIQIEASDKNIRLYVENSFEDGATGDDKQGIGLENLIRRLEILYPGKYSFTAKNTGYSYSTVLMIDA